MLPFVKFWTVSETCTLWMLWVYVMQNKHMATDSHCFTCAWHEPLCTVWDVFFPDPWFCLTSVPQHQKALCILYRENNKILFDKLFFLPAGVEINFISKKKNPLVMHFVAQPVEVSNKCYFY